MNELVTVAARSAVVAVAPDLESVRFLPVAQTWRFLSLFYMRRFGMPSLVWWIAAPVFMVVGTELTIISKQ